MWLAVAHSLLSFCGLYKYTFKLTNRSARMYPNDVKPIAVFRVHVPDDTSSHTIFVQGGH